MTDEPWPYPGSRWWKFDFHAHTPASCEYGKGPQQQKFKNLTPREWLLNYMRAGIDCVAVTDHNSGAWIDRLKSALEELKLERPEGFRPIYLFPGVEISVNGGVHLLAIFDPSTTTSHIDSLLGAVEFIGTKGKSDDVTQKSFVEVVDAVSRFGGIAIPAHVDCGSGLFTAFKGTTLIQALKHNAILAMEVVDPSWEKPKIYHDMEVRWTEVIGSDAHYPADTEGQSYPGSRFTWVKMGTPNLEGLRLALLDGTLSVRRCDAESGNPNKHADLVIEGIEVTQARYMGRSEPFKLDLSPWLNAIIGGRGTGKSTLVEFMRLAFRREAEVPDALREDLRKYWETYQSRDDDGLLTPDTELTVTYRKDRARFRIRWSKHADVEPIEVQDENGVWKPDRGVVAQRFPVRIYSQKQIFELAKDPLALLKIVDEASEVDRRGWEEVWKQEEARYLSLRAQERLLEAGLADEPALLGLLEDVKRKLAIFEEMGHAAILREYGQRLDQQQEVDSWERTWAGSGDRLRELARSLVPQPLDGSLFDSCRPEDQDIQEKAEAARSSLEALAEQVEKLAGQADRILAQWRQARKDSLWRIAVERAISDYQKLVQRLKDEEAGDPSAYGTLVQWRQGIEDKLRELESRREELARVRAEAAELLARLGQWRRKLTQKRRDFLSTVLRNNPYVRIEVVQYGVPEAAETALRHLLNLEDGRFERDIEALVGRIYQNGRENEKIEQGLTEVKQDIRAIASGTFQGSLADQRFAQYLRRLPPETLDRVDLWFPEDSLRVQYSTTADGSNFRSIQEGSPGQKTAAILAFLLSYGDEPIVLDQPEDDLDNRVIYDLIVRQLRGIKQRRQVIVVTHNANIVVNGDAELVTALVARGGETHKECSDCLQDRRVRETICTVMEGGREAFEQRWKRLGNGARMSG